MASVTTFDELFARVSNDYTRSEPIYFYNAATSTTSPFGANGGTGQYYGRTKAVPTLETGVTAYIPSKLEYVNSVVNTTMVLARMINLGALTLGNGAGGASSFSDGNAMPSMTQLGASRTVWSPVLGVVETAVTATPGTFTITYVDQSGNTAETSGAFTPAASAVVGSAGFLWPLNTGDAGVQDITAAARSGGTNPGGVIRFYGIIPLSISHISPANSSFSTDFITTRPTILRMAAGEQLMLFRWGALNTAGTILGRINYIGDS